MTPHDFCSILERLRHRAHNQGKSPAYVFLGDGETETASLTYAELDLQSRAIGATLQQSVEPGARAFLMYPPGLGFIAAFFGCLYAGVVAVPVCPPNPARPDRMLPRLRAIAKDAQISVVLTTEMLAVGGDKLLAGIPELEETKFLPSSQIDLEKAAAWQEPIVDPKTIAFLQYTSGSTATPKGVMVSHGNVLHNLAYIHGCEGNGTDSCSVSWLPAHHDMGLIEGLLQPAFGGYRAYLMAPVTFLQRPARWLTAISRYRATNSGGPDFAYDLCVRKITSEQRRELDLRSWRIAYNGSEPIRKDTIDRFTRVFADCGFTGKAFRPVYGLAEATLLVSSGGSAGKPVIKTVDPMALARDQVRDLPKGEGTGVTLVGCGRPSCATKVVIARCADLTTCLPGEVGEVWVSSPSVTQGYWRRCEESERTFRAVLADTGEGPFLRTGDLGFIWDGELFITGRIKDVIIIRGRKLYPQDIELCVERSHPAIRPGCAAVFSIPSADGEQLVVMAEVERCSTRSMPTRGKVNRTDQLTGLEIVIGSMREAVADLHEAPVAAIALLYPGSIPKTSSGKLQRFTCRERFTQGTLSVLAQWPHVESINNA